MADCNNVDKHEIGSFIKDVPQDVVEKHLNDPILITFACNADTFTRSDVLRVARRVGIKMGASTAWLVECLKNNVVRKYEYKTSNIGETYYIEPVWWLEFMRVLDVNEIKKRQIRRGGLQENPMLAIAVNAFLHGLDYLDVLKESQRFSSLMRDSSLYMYYMHGIAKYPFMLGLVKSSDDNIRDHVSMRFKEKICDYRMEGDDFAAMEELVAYECTNSCVTTEMGEALAVFAFYYDFVKDADIRKARKRVGNDMYMLSFFDGVEMLQGGDYDKAVKCFAKSLKGNGKWFRHAGMNYYYVLALQYSGLSTSKTKLESIYKDKEYIYQNDGALFVAVSLAKKLEFTSQQTLKYVHGLANKAFALIMLKHYQKMDGISDEDVDSLLGMVDAIPLQAVQVEMTKDFGRYKGMEEELEKKTGLRPLLQAYEVKPEWENMLDELIELNGEGKESRRSAAGERVAYEVNLENMSVQPKLQKSKNGVAWSAGRNIAMNKFMNGDVKCMTVQDRKVALCVKEYSYGWYGGVSYELGGNEAVAALVGHPYVYDVFTDAHLDIVEAKLQLSVRDTGNGYKITSDVNISEGKGGYVIDTSMKPTVRVVRVGGPVMKTVQSLAGASMPVAAKEKLTRLMENLSSKMVIMGDLLKDSEKVEEMKAHSEIVVQLKPAGEQIQCVLMVKPFGTSVPVCKPGKGMEVVTASIDGKAVRTKRSLKKERDNYEAVQALLVNYEDDGDNSWALEPGECLDLLDHLRDMPKRCVVEWPEGERFRVASAPIQASMLHVSVNSLSSWFEMSGEVNVGSGVKMKMAELMERLRESVGNFIRLNDDDYVRISDDLRRYLDTIGRIGSVSKNKVRVSAFNAVQLEGMEESGMQLDADEAFRSLLARVSEAQDVPCKVPKNIQADLRSYQKEGYEWMTRLAYWGAGALLADDMGLGKTVQTITMLLSRASMGPQLVVVPTSLVLNWRDEMARFAPSLSVLVLNRAGEDREAMVKNAKAYDIVVTTYGLLITEEETLTSRSWTTIVLDEAHTIKNKETKMSKAAMELKSDFRVLLTGTPLQNHVSEMWNLMQFANPGLLGTFQQFNDRFLVPIERDHDKDVQRVLRRIISPFILRRTKTDVLSELPEKTEITVKVDLSEEEMAFYEHIREEALANLADSSSTAMQALAEITRLRQAACNTRLVNDKVDVPSSKLESFMALMDNLHANHHRALVFSQFTSHLALVRERLDKEGVEYLYLDGSTSAKERIRLVEEFQHGDMPLFLISLKAGGLGLNLTAADYVIHLDPWWNPAIEEQASDRAYRIGQKKPVTVYRLIASGTIEEKILNLHATKKNMADALLEGGDVSASMSRDEMIRLLRENVLL